MPIANEPVAAWATDCRDKYPENHDSGYAGRICMADGNLAWAAVVSDGAGGSMAGLKISALAVQAFVEAVRGSTLAELADSAARDAWLRSWTKNLHDEAWSRFKGGHATFCGAVILPPAAEEGELSERAAARRDGAPSSGGWKLFTLNVGDSQVLELTGDGRSMVVTPDAPPNNANVESGSPVRMVGMAPKGGFCLVDAEEFPLPAEGPCWILAGSDGFFFQKKGTKELAIFAAGDFRDLCRDSKVPFQDLPALAIRRSLSNARKLGCAEMMDNATVAMLGFRVPATDLAASGEASAVQAAAPVPQARPPASGTLAAQGAAAGSQSRPATAGADEAVRRGQGVPAAVSGGQATAKVSAAGSGGRLAIVAGAALIAGTVLGCLLGSSGGESRRPEKSDEPGAVLQTVPDPSPTDMAAAAERIRCKICWKRYLDGQIPLEETFHWADDPMLHPKPAVSGGDR